MSFQIVLRLVRFAANGAVELIKLIVRPHVKIEMSLRCEMLFAQITFEVFETLKI